MQQEISVTQLIRRAQKAVGGLDRIRSVRTYFAELVRVPMDGSEPITITVWRAAGGHIRIEESTSEQTTVRATSGTGDPLDGEEASELRRAARISPRNLLAHADEYELVLREQPAPDGSRIVSFPAEFAVYVFDPSTFLCSLMMDLSRDHKIRYTDYREVDGIFTPFEEIHVTGQRTLLFRDRYLIVSYNDEFPEGSF